MVELAGGVGTTVEQDDTDLGTVKQYYNGDPVDYAFVERSSVNERIAGENNNYLYYPIDGIVTNDELANNVGDESYKLKTQGHATCRDEGKITYISTDIENGNVRTAGSVESGDSGGTLFKLNNANIYVAGVIRESYAFPDDTGSTTAEAVEDYCSGYWQTT